MTMWMVRSRNGELIPQFLQRGVAAIGWIEVGNPKQYQDKREILAALDAYQPEWGKKAGTRKVGAAQLWRFLQEVRLGDRVITYDPQRRIYYVGRVTGRYRFDPEYESAPNAYPVQWEGTVRRDDLTSRSRELLRAQLTFFRVREKVAMEIEALMEPTT